MKKLLILFVVLPFICYLQTKFDDYKSSFEIKSNETSVMIPFEMLGKNILMKARINGIECNVLLDNGSVWDDLLFFGSPKVDV